MGRQNNGADDVRGLHAPLSQGQEGAGAGGTGLGVCLGQAVDVPLRCWNCGQNLVSSRGWGYRQGKLDQNVVLNFSLMDYL